MCLSRNNRLSRLSPNNSRFITKTLVEAITHRLCSKYHKPNMVHSCTSTHSQLVISRRLLLRATSRMVIQQDPGCHRRLSTPRSIITCRLNNNSRLWCNSTSNSRWFNNSTSRCLWAVATYPHTITTRAWSRMSPAATSPFTPITPMYGTLVIRSWLDPRCPLNRTSHRRRTLYRWCLQVCPPVWARCSDKGICRGSNRCRCQEGSHRSNTDITCTD